MKKNTMRSPVEIVICLGLLLGHPLPAQEAVPQPSAADTQQQQLQPETPAAQPLETPVTPAPQTAVKSSPENDAARYFAGLALAPGSPLTALTQDPRWAMHARAMNLAFSQLEQRQLNNIRIFRSENVAPATQASRTCVYFFSGPDFLYADAMFSDCSTFVLQGLEAVDPVPDLLTTPPAALAGTLENIQASLNTLLSFSFFKTKDMRQDFQRAQLKGVLPVIFVFMARTGKEIESVEYISLDKDGKVVQAQRGFIRGAKIDFVDPASGSRKAMYYFTSDLSDDALKRNPALLRFCEGLGPANSLLKAASYLLHGGNFTTIRNFLLQNSASVLQDDSGIPVRYFTPDKWNLRFFGAYTGPIDLFKNYFQPDLRQYYEASSPKRLTFGFGYKWNNRSSTLFLAVRKN
ncbi:MAG TPA: hypothetical protein VGY91_06595 [Chthoniobacterales bacterium]|jgi:hypothetical protein|nr:hypothetical protein [Chthoniobacterales bacterium]